MPDGRKNGVEIDVTRTDGPIRVVYGRDNIQARPIFKHVTDGSSKNQYLHVVYEIGEGEIDAVEEVYFDKVISSDSRFTKRGGGQWHRIQWLPGTDDQQAFPDLVSETNGLWSVNHRCRGTALLYVRYERDRDQKVWRGQDPQVTVTLRGRKVLDIRDDVVKWTENPALHTWDYLTNQRFGKGYHSSRLNASLFALAADRCDQGNQITVHRERCEYDTETRQTICSPIAPETKTVPLFTCNTTLNTENSILENTRTLLSSCRGYLPPTAGQLNLVIEDAGPSICSIVSDDVIGEVISKSQTKSSRYNQVTVRFRNPALGYENDEVSYPEVDDPLYQQWLEEDNNVPLRHSVTIDTIKSPAEAMQMAKVLARLSRDASPLEITIRRSSKTSKILPSSIIDFTDPNRGWVQRKFRVQEMVSDKSDQLRLNLTAHFDDIYPWSVLEYNQREPATNLGDPWNLSAPTNVAIEFDSTLSTTGLVRWQHEADTFVRTYRVVVEVQSESNWLEVLSDTRPAETFVLPRLDIGNYRIRISALSNSGYSSDDAIVTFTVALPVAPSSIVVVPDNFTLQVMPKLTGAAYNTTFDIEVSETSDRAEAFMSTSGTSVLVASLSSDKDYWVFARTRNALGVSEWISVQTKTLKAPERIIDVLDGAIPDAALTQELRARIDLIDDPEEGLIHQVSQIGGVIDGKISAYDETIKSYIYEETGALRTQRTVRVSTNGVVAGFGMLADEIEGSKIYFSANQIGFLNNPEDDLEDAGDFPLVVEDGITFINEARIRTLDANRLQGGDAVLDTLTVRDELSVPFGWVQDNHLRPDFLRTLVRRNPDAETTGGSVSGTRNFSSGVGATSLGGYNSGGFENHVSFNIGGNTLVSGSGSPPPAPTVKVRIRETSTGTWLSFGGNTEVTITGTVTPEDSGGGKTIYSVAISAALDTTFTPPDDIAVSYELHITAITGTPIPNGFVTAAASESIQSDDGITVMLDWDEIQDKPFDSVSSDFLVSGSSPNRSLTLAPVSVAKGGTGHPTLTANAVLVGNGTSPVSLVSRSGIDTRAAFPPASHTHAAGDITSGTLADARIPNLNASKVTAGTFADARIPNTIARLAANQIFTGNNTFSNTVIVDGGVGVGTSGVLRILQNGDGVGNGIGITSSNPIAHRIWKAANGDFNIGTAGSPNQLTITTSGAISWSGVASGNGSGITNLSASSISSGTIDAGRLPSTAVLTNTTQTIIGSKTFTQGTNWAYPNSSQNRTPIEINHRAQSGWAEADILFRAPTGNALPSMSARFWSANNPNSTHATRIGMQCSISATNYMLGIELDGQTQTITFGRNTTSDMVLSSGGLNLTQGNYSGNGSGLTNLNASNVSSGTLNVNRLPNSVVLQSSNILTNARLVSTERDTFNGNVLSLDNSGMYWLGGSASNVPANGGFLLFRSAASNYSSLLVGTSGDRAWISGHNGTYNELAVLNQNQTFTGINTFSNRVIMGQGGTTSVPSVFINANNPGNGALALAVTMGTNSSGRSLFKAYNASDIGLEVRGDGLTLCDGGLIVSGGSRSPGRFYGGTASPTSSSARLNFDGVLHVFDLDTLSSRRYKNIEQHIPPSKAADNVRRIGRKGVSVGHYKENKERRRQRWLIAEDVAEVLREPVTFDEKGRPDSLSSGQLVPELYAAFAHAMDRIERLEAQLGRVVNG
ncbi:MAG: hypothetical protein JJU10_05435 [Idiomarina sp.]|nr:hypothetical protein [Idiomarina sp.]